jgi:hypothetical protein
MIFFYKSKLFILAFHVILGYFIKFKVKNGIKIYTYFLLLFLMESGEGVKG